MLDIFSNTNMLLLLAVLWVLPWKGYALWLSARREEKWWFVAILIVNTLAILEIVYIFLIVKRKNVSNTNIGIGNKISKTKDKHNISIKATGAEIIKKKN